MIAYSVYTVAQELNNAWRQLITSSIDYSTVILVYSPTACFAKNDCKERPKLQRKADVSISRTFPVPT